MHLLTKSLTAAILIFALLSAGCTDTDSSSANNPTAVATSTQAATVEPTVVATESHWWDGKTNYEQANVHTLFGNDLEGVKAPMSQPGNYNLFNTDAPVLILKHQEFPHFDPYDDLQPDQARALEAQYGEAELVVMEQADTDGDGALDAVAVRYVGSKAEFKVGLFTCSVEISDDYLLGHKSFDACFKNLPSDEYCEYLPPGPSSLLYLHLEPNAEWILSIVEQLY